MFPPIVIEDLKLAHTIQNALMEYVASTLLRDKLGVALLRVLNQSPVDAIRALHLVTMEVQRLQEQAPDELSEYTTVPRETSTQETTNED